MNVNNRNLILIRAGLIIAFGFRTALAEPIPLAQPTSHPLMLITTNGDRAQGTWSDVRDSLVVAWQSSGFDQPFLFPTQHVRFIQSLHDVAHEEPEPGLCACQLTTGDVLIGKLTELSDNQLDMQLTSGQSVSVPRRFVRCLTAHQQHQFLKLVGATNGGLLSYEEGTWEYLAGRLVATMPEASAWANLDMPPQCTVQLDLAWSDSPDFKIEIFRQGLGDGLSVATWGKQIVLLLNGKATADVLKVGESSGSARTEQRISLRLFLDLEAGTIVAFADGSHVGQLERPAGFPSGFQSNDGRISIEDVAGCLALEDMSVVHSHNTRPIESAPDHLAVQLGDGERIVASSVGWDAGTSEFVVTATGPSPPSGQPTDRSDSAGKEGLVAEPTAGGESNAGASSPERRFKLDEIHRILFPTRAPPTSTSVGLRVTDCNGMHVAGAYEGCRNGRVLVRVSWAKGAIEIPVTQLSSAQFLQTTADVVDSGLGSVGQLRMAGIDLRGTLCPGSRDDVPLAWHPVASSNAAGLLPIASGSIAYDRCPVRPAPAPTAPRRQGFFGNLARWLNLDKPNRPPAPKTLSTATLELRSGDSIPAKPQSIESSGVVFSSEMTEVTHVPHHLIQAISLGANVSPAELTQIKRERFLTLPRKQADYPPTHLLLSTSGDLLRGRLISMDAKSVKVEVRMTPREIPRNHVAAIVWLHPHSDEPQNSKSTDENGQMRILAVETTGQRLMLVPQHVKDDLLVGRSPVLESCQVNLRKVQRIAFGDQIQSEISQLPTSQVGLRPAVLPRYAKGSPDEPSTQLGQASPLVGQPAPALSLTRLDGSSFDLSAMSGRVVVIDFWASWCGPCIQWMPRLESIMSDYEGEGVSLVTVNLAETKTQAEAVLERLEISPLVLLDIDGVAAEAYRADAIPLTVIVGPDGVVDRVFTGVAKQVEAPLREAIENGLQELIPTPASDEPGG